MKTLVAYYTRTGVTREVAINIAEQLEAEIEQIIDKKSRKGALGWIMAGRDGIKGEKTEIGKIEKNPKDYDLVVIGSPVWAGHVTPAVRTYLSKFKFKKVAFFCTQGAQSPQHVFADMLELVPHVKVKGKFSLRTKEVKAKDFDKVYDFAEKLKKR